MKYFTSSLLLISIFAFMTKISNSQPTIPDFSTSDRKTVPIEYTWNMEDIYKTLDLWNADKEKVVNMIPQVVELSKDWTTSPQKMLSMMLLMEDIDLIFSRLYAYAGHQSNADIGNSQFVKMKGELQSISVDYSSKLSFFNDDVLKLGEANFNSYLNQEPKLEPYRFTFEQILRMKEHVLAPDLQKIVSMTGLFSGGYDQASSILNNLEIPSAEVTLSTGKKVVLNYANYSFYRGSKNRDDRILVMTAFWNNHKKFENTHAVLLENEMKKHWFYAKTSNFGDCLTSRVFRNNIDTAVYHQLIRSVHENLTPLHKYINLKKELLKLNQFKYDDIYASAVNQVDKVYSYDEAETIIKDALKPLGSEYADILKHAFADRWIDRYPNKGKESGAYSDGLFGIHPYIKMNYTGDYNSLTTLAHELGHSGHSFLSDKYQPYSNAQYTTFLAEIASTFNESMLMKYLLKNENDDMFKLYLLDHYLDGARGTIYRQTLFAEFELFMHQTVESGKSLTPDVLNKKYLDLTREYYGHDKGVTVVDEYIQNEWSNIPHFYMNYYVFQYSTGMIASMALCNMVLNGGDKGREDYLTMLKSGGKDFPLTLLKSAGVDMTKPESINGGLKYFDSLVDEMQNLVTKLKKEGKL